LDKKGWATFLAFFLLTHLVTLAEFLHRGKESGFYKNREQGDQMGFVKIAQNGAHTIFCQN
jgi:hypothetical protein